MVLRFPTYSSPEKVFALTVSKPFDAENTHPLSILPDFRQLLFALSLTVLVGFGLAQSALAKTFELGVQHTDVLPSVSDDLRKGARFNLSAVEAEGQSNEWIQLPDWMCGTWKVGKETAVLRRDFKSNKTNNEPFTYFARHEFQYGMQKDRDGGIWHYIGTPYHSKTALAQFTEYHLVKSKDFTKADEQEVSFTTVMTVIRSDSSSKIIESFQQESITSYKPSQLPGEIEMSASTKSFEANGAPDKQSDNVAKIKQSSPFKQVDTYQGKDMKVLFRAFLIGRKLNNLLPESAE